MNVDGRASKQAPAPVGRQKNHVTVSGFAQPPTFSWSSTAIMMDIDDEVVQEISLNELFARALNSASEASDKPTASDETQASKIMKDATSY